MEAADAPGSGPEEDVHEDAEAQRQAAIARVLALQEELDEVTRDLADVQGENSRLDERNSVLAEYVDNLMHTVSTNHMAVTQPVRPKGVLRAPRLPNLGGIGRRNHVDSRAQGPT